MKDFSGSLNGDTAGCPRTGDERDLVLQMRIEEERARISRELHDELGQHLVALKFVLSSLVKRVGEADPALTAGLASVMALVDLTVKSVQTVALKLRPVVLDDLGLVEAIEWQVRQFERTTGIACGLRLDEVPADLAPQVATTLFRILQETLTNVARHAGASRVDVTLRRTGETLVLETGDDGCGMPGPRPAGVSLGLMGMRERARSVNGSLAVTGGAGKGTRVTARVPLIRKTT